MGGGQSQILTSIPAGQGGMRLDRGLSDFHRGQRLTLSYIWVVPGPTKGWRSYALGGWSIAASPRFSPESIYRPEWSDRTRRVTGTDRADIGNPAAPLFSRAVVNAPAVPAIEIRTPTPASRALRCAGFRRRWSAPTPPRSAFHAAHGRDQQLRPDAVQVLPIREGKRLELRWRLTMPSIIRSLCKSPNGMSSARLARRADFHRA